MPSASGQVRRPHRTADLRTGDRGDQNYPNPVRSKAVAVFSRSPDPSETSNAANTIVTRRPGKASWQKKSQTLPKEGYAGKVGCRRRTATSLTKRPPLCRGCSVVVEALSKHPPHQRREAFDELALRLCRPGVSDTRHRSRGQASFV